jgi:hypothetical protein
MKIIVALLRYFFSICLEGVEKLMKNLKSRDLTPFVRAEYIYSTASHASRPDRVLILCDFHKVVK